MVLPMLPFLESPNRSIPLWQMHQHQQTSLLHIQSKCFQTAAFVLCPRVSESACEPFKNSLTSQALGSPRHKPCTFQRQVFWGLFSLAQPPRVGVPKVGPNPSLLRETLWSCKMSPDCRSPQEVGFLVRPRFCLSYPSLCGPFIVYCEEAVQPVFRVFSE